MTGGIDRGACFSYRRLSYRRKFIRTVWYDGGIVLPLVALAQLAGVLPRGLWKSGVPAPHRSGWLLVGLCALGVGLQGGYTWFRWRREQARTAANSGSGG